MHTVAHNMPTHPRVLYTIICREFGMQCARKLRACCVQVTHIVHICCFLMGIRMLYNLAGT